MLREPAAGLSGEPRARRRRPGFVRSRGRGPAARPTPGGGGLARPLAAARGLLRGAIAGREGSRASGRLGGDQTAWVPSRRICAYCGAGVFPLLKLWQKSRADPSSRNIHVAPRGGAATRLRGISTWQPRRRNDPVVDYTGRRGRRRGRRGGSHAASPRGGLRRQRRGGDRDRQAIVGERGKPARPELGVRAARGHGAPTRSAGGHCCSQLCGNQALVSPDSNFRQNFAEDV